MTGDILFVFCEDESALPLRCDIRKGHSGRHKERWVATWAPGGSDVRCFSEGTGKYVAEPIANAV